MLRRCEDAKAANYERYGGRGISVCEEWHTFVKFYSWALENGYDPGLQLDRIDNDGPYSPDNCRFQTLQQNSNNRRSSKYVTAFGETKTVADWGRDGRCVVSYNTLRARLLFNWVPETALTTEKRPGRWK